MPRRLGVVANAALVLMCVGVIPLATPSGDAPLSRQEAATAQRAKPKKTPYDKLAEPWPDAGRLRQRRAEAEALPLFKDVAPLSFTLEADFKAIGRDRDPDSTKQYPATLSVPGHDGAIVTIPVSLNTRGRSRLNPRVCSFVPLGIELPKKGVKGTPFDGQQSMKLVTHCQNDRDHDQYVLLEHLAYRIFNVLTPNSFRTRLAKGTYVDVTNHRTLSTHNAMFIEDDGDVARRMEGRVVNLPRLRFDGLDQESLMRLMVFQYLIGNTDFSIWALHNVGVVATPNRVLYPIAWDFDLTGLVNPPYGLPDPRFNISSVRERLYRGPCKSLDELEPHLTVFRATQAEVMGLIDSVPELESRRRDTARGFLNQFYSTLARRERLKKELVDKCRPQELM